MKTKRYNSFSMSALQALEYKTIIQDISKMRCSIIPTHFKRYTVEVNGVKTKENFKTCEVLESLIRKGCSNV